MPYVPQTWTDGAPGGTPITAAKLNHIEAGISAVTTPTKADIGLGNCDNTSDVNKPVSTAQAARAVAMALIFGA